MDDLVVVELECAEVKGGKVEEEGEDQGPYDVGPDVHGLVLEFREPRGQNRLVFSPDLDHFFIDVEA